MSEKVEVESSDITKWQTIVDRELDRFLLTPDQKEKVILRLHAHDGYSVVIGKFHDEYQAYRDSVAALRQLLSLIVREEAAKEKK